MTWITPTDGDHLAALLAEPWPSYIDLSRTHPQDDHDMEIPRLWVDAAYPKIIRGGGARLWCNDRGSNQAIGIEGLENGGGKRNVRWEHLEIRTNASTGVRAVNMNFARWTDVSVIMSHDDEAGVVFENDGPDGWSEGNIFDGLRVHGGGIVHKRGTGRPSHWFTEYRHLAISGAKHPFTLAPGASLAGSTIDAMIWTDDDLEGNPAFCLWGSVHGGIELRTRIHNECSTGLFVNTDVRGAHELRGWVAYTHRVKHGVLLYGDGGEPGVQLSYGAEEAPVVNDVERLTTGTPPDPEPEPEPEPPVEPEPEPDPEFVPPMTEAELRQYAIDTGRSYVKLDKVIDSWLTVHLHDRVVDFGGAVVNETVTIEGQNTVVANLRGAGKRTIGRSGQETHKSGFLFAEAGNTDPDNDLTGSYFNKRGTLVDCFILGAIGHSNDRVTDGDSFQFGNAAGEKLIRFTLWGFSFRGRNTRPDGSDRHVDKIQFWGSGDSIEDLTIVDTDPHVDVGGASSAAIMLSALSGTLTLAAQVEEHPESFHAIIANAGPSGCQLRIVEPGLVLVDGASAVFKDGGGWTLHPDSLPAPAGVTLT